MADRGFSIDDIQDPVYTAWRTLYSGGFAFLAAAFGDVSYGIGRDSEAGDR